MLRGFRHHGVGVLARARAVVLLGSGFLLGTGGCGQLAATWDQSGAGPAVEAYGRGEPTLPSAGSSSVGEGGAAGDASLPHPEGCGDRRGPPTLAHDTRASCPLPTTADIADDGGTLPLARFGAPALLLGDDALYVTERSPQATLYDLYAKREIATLTLTGGLVGSAVVGDDQRICLVLDVAGMSLQCFDRTLTASPWTLQLYRQTGAVVDMLLDGNTLWLQYAFAGFGELIAVNVANGSVLWRQPPLDGSGRIVRVGEDLVGYDQQPCPELPNPEVCLRAIDATSGAPRATSAAQYQRFVWSNGAKALFSNSTEFIEYDASLGSFSDVSVELLPLVEALGSAELNALGEPLSDGRVLILVGAAGASPELAVVDPTALTFRKLGISAPKLLRVHEDVLVADGALVTLSDAAPPAGTASLWFGIFGFDDSATYARKIR